MKLYYETELGKLYQGDIAQIEEIIDKDSVDLIITDPPYPRQYFYCYENLAKITPWILKSGGSLVTIIPHYNFLDVANLFKPPMKWRWMLHLSHMQHSHARMSMGIEVTFKPMGWFVKDKLPINKCRNFVIDGIDVTKEDGYRKKLHKWQQSTQWCEYYIKKLAYDNELVVDPFVGSGTTAIVCEKLKRRWIAVDIDESACEISKQRLINNAQEI